MGDIDGLRTELREPLEELIRRGRKIEAIKLYREATGLGLAEAKHAVEGIAAESRGQVGLEPHTVRPSSGCSGAVVAVAGLLLTFGCVTSAKVDMLTDHEYPPSDHVQVLHDEPEDRSFVVIATLRLDLVRYDEEFAISRFTKRAMEIGADAIVIREPQTRNIPGAYLPPEPGRDDSFLTGGSRRVLVTAKALRFSDR